MLNLFIFSGPKVVSIWLPILSLQYLQYYFVYAVKKFSLSKVSYFHVTLVALCCTDQSTVQWHRGSTLHIDHTQNVPNGWACQCSCDRAEATDGLHLCIACHRLQGRSLPDTGTLWVGGWYLVPNCKGIPFRALVHYE